jgi:hypothetical protein
MRKLIALLLIAPLLQGCRQKVPNGRFQIVTGTYDEIVGNYTPPHNDTPYQQHGIFKIDTQTGETWVYKDVVNIASDGTAWTTEGWREITNVTTTVQKPN